jgi:hypothetical protein
MSKEPQPTYYPVYIEQFIADLKLLPEEKLLVIVNGLPNENNLPALECIHVHVKEFPNRIPQLFALVVSDMPYYPVIRHFRWISMKQIFTKFGKRTFQVLGEARTAISILSLLVEETGDQATKNNADSLLMLKDAVVKEVPNAEKVTELDSEISKELVLVEDLGKRDLATLLTEAQQRAVKAEKELKDAKINWAKHTNRLNEQAARGKNNILNETTGANKKLLDEVTANFQAELKQKNDELKSAIEQLKAAQARLVEIEELGGATPEQVATIIEDFRLEADRRVEDEISINVRPWLARLEEMEQKQKKLEEFKILTCEALRVAREESLKNDILLSWELDRERALKVLEAEVAELDNLMCRVFKPSDKLKKMHSAALKAMLDCRKQLYPDKPHGEVAKAIIAGIRKVKDGELSEVEYAVKKLAEKGVFLSSEAESLIRIVENEKQQRYDQTHHRQSVQAQMIRKLHNNETVDVLIDGYNLMFAAESLFGEKLKLSRNTSGEAVFGEEGRNKLNQILMPVVTKFPKIDIHIFYDGLVKENKNPHPRITLWQPTYQKTGKGQADAEIAFVGLKRIRKGAMPVVVTNDKEIRKYADYFLSIRIFTDFLVTL